MAELQKAVAIAERRAMDLVANERLKMERIISAAATRPAASLDNELGKEPKVADMDTASTTLENQVRDDLQSNKEKSIGYTRNKPKVQPANLSHFYSNNPLLHLIAQRITDL